jgi:isoaspartyl peptidase/L-asparaginase-like protein (Ntn-hydrolase superfamily)
MLRCLTAKLACERMAQGDDAAAALAAALQRTASEAGSDLGLIGVDARGTVGIVHATPLMPHAFVIEGHELVARLGMNQPP